MLLISNESDKGARLKVVKGTTRSSSVASSVNDENEENEQDGDNDGSGGISARLAPVDAKESQSLAASVAHLVSSLNSSTANNGSEARLVSSLTSCADNDGSEARLVSSFLTSCADDNDGSDDVSVSPVPEEFIESQSLTVCTARLVSFLARCTDRDFTALALQSFAWSRRAWPTFLQAAVSPISYQQPLLPFLRSLKKCPPCRRISLTTETITAVL
jgi:hypothetical protein